MLYAIQAGDVDGPVKLGHAVNPGARLDALQTGNHNGLYLLGTCWGGRREEARLHDRYRATHLRGEWFRATPALLSAIGDWFAGDLAEVDKQSQALRGICDEVALLAQVAVRARRECWLTMAHRRALARLWEPRVQLLLAKCSLKHNWCARYLERQVDAVDGPVAVLSHDDPSRDRDTWGRALKDYLALEAHWLGGSALDPRYAVATWWPSRLIKQP